MSDEEDDLNTGKSDSKANSSGIKSGDNQQGRNPNPEWQKKFGRTSCNNNVYEIKDIEDKECGTSTEWCTPQSSANCGLCLMVMAFVGIILMIYSLAIGINDWKSDYAAAGCGEDNPNDFTVGDKLSQTDAWVYCSGAIIVTSIVALASGCYSFWTDRAFIIDENGESDRELQKWNMSQSRVCCRCQLSLWVFIFTMLIIWFWIMVSITAALADIARATNCTDDDVQDAARDKNTAFGILIALAVICGLCCGVPFVCIQICGRGDDDRKDRRS